MELFLNIANNTANGGQGSDVGLSETDVNDLISLFLLPTDRHPEAEQINAAVSAVNHWLEACVARSASLPAVASCSSMISTISSSGGTDIDADLRAINRMLAEIARQLAPQLQAADRVQTPSYRMLSRLVRLWQLESQFETTLQREKLASLKQLAYGASHEVNNPLGNIATRAQSLMRSENDPDRRQQLAMIVSQAFRAHDMIGDMMLYAHPPTPAFEHVDLNEAAARAIAELESQAEAKGTVIEYRSETKPAMISADPNQVVVMIAAIVRNSIDSFQRDGTVVVSCFATEKSVAIRVADDGPGLSELARRHLFDPFFSGREAGRGLGFGLCIAKTIVELHGGEIQVGAACDEGSMFTVLLPRAEAESNAGQQLSGHENASAISSSKPIH